MSTDNDLTRVRKAFLDAVNDPQEESDALRAMVVEFQSRYPGILVAHVANDNVDPIDHNALHWTEKYFSTQRDLAKRNFSMDRLTHLIDVRDRFRGDGRKGFVPKAMTANQSFASGAGYRPSEALQKIIEEGDIQTLQTALLVELEDRRNDSARLRSTLAWARGRLPGLCEPYTEKGFAKSIDSDHQKWTSDYYAKQAVYLETNFSEERYLHLVDVREHLRRQEAKASAPAAAPGASRPSPKAQPGAKPASGPRASEPPRRPAQQPSSRNLSPTLSAALLVGGALAVVVILLLVLRK